VLAGSGWQVAVHANGDSAIQQVLDAASASPVQARRAHLRIEHVEVLREDQLDKIAELGILLSFFVKRIHYWGDVHRDRLLGPERAVRSFPLASAAARGITFALHSDSPLTPVSPVEGIWAASTRVTEGGDVLGPGQRITAERAIRAYTVDAARMV